ncbi:MAG: hypothetical protein ED859_08635 [Desulfuromonadales bacterium]|nr:MAG: hypothetical protein ED859_08635 [Desulfuromonadales bacterium]
MKSIVLACVVTALASPVFASSDVGFDVNVNIGNRPQVVVPAPPPVVIEEPPVFIVPPRLGFYVGIDVPYDIFYISGRYYLWQGNVWYRAHHYNGPWGVVKYKSLPPGLRKHKLERIRYYRDDEYRVYRVEHDHYRGKHYKPEKEWKEYRKEEHRRMKEDKKQEKEERKHHKKGKHHGDD